MRRMAWVLAGLAVVALAAVGGPLAFDAPAKPPPLASIRQAFADVDFSDLPPVATYEARDGTALGYRAYEGGSDQVVVLIHGSSGDGTGMHPLAKALRAAGATVIAPVLRGHGGFGRKGDLDYTGQLTDDLADLVAVLRQRYPAAGFSLVGFSSGGGFVLRAIAGPEAALFDRFVMISPALPHDAPTIRPDTGGWVSVAVPRIIVLSMLNRAGIDRFNRLPVIAFATAPGAENLTSLYSYRMTFGFAAPPDYLAALGRSAKPAALLVGGDDELFYPDRFAPLIHGVRPDLPVTVVPGVGHIGMSVDPAGVAAVVKAYRALVAGADG